MIKKRVLAKLVSLYILLPAIVYCVPLKRLDSLPSLCVYKNSPGKECIGCGITRALFFAFRGHFRSAFEYNPMIIAVLPLVLILYIDNLRKDIKILKMNICISGTLFKKGAEK